jgi:hypothetical protein
MTKSQKALLAQHAKHFQDMVAFVITRDSEELRTLLEACQAASQTNCGWDTYAAAQYIGREILIELRVRERKAAEAKAAGDGEDVNNAGR